MRSSSVSLGSPTPWGHAVSRSEVDEFVPHGWDVNLRIVCEPDTNGSEEGSCLRLIDFFYHSTLGLRVIKREEEWLGASEPTGTPPLLERPLSGEYGTHKTVKARFWP